MTLFNLLVTHYGSNGLKTVPLGNWVHEIEQLAKQGALEGRGREQISQPDKLFDLHLFKSNK